MTHQNYWDVGYLDSRKVMDGVPIRSCHFAEEDGTGWDQKAVFEDQDSQQQISGRERISGHAEMEMHNLGCYYIDDASALETSHAFLNPHHARVEHLLTKWPDAVQIRDV